MVDGELGPCFFFFVLLPLVVPLQLAVAADALEVDDCFLSWSGSVTLISMCESESATTSNWAESDHPFLSIYSVHENTSKFNLVVSNKMREQGEHLLLLLTQGLGKLVICSTALWTLSAVKNSLS